MQLKNIFNVLKTASLIEEEEEEESNLIVRNFAVDDVELCDDSDIAVKLSSSILMIEMKNCFKDLSTARSSVILKSHMEIHGLEDYDDSVDIELEDLPNTKNEKKSLILSSKVTPESLDLLEFVLKGLATKRGTRLKNSKVDVVDNKYREQYLKFLKYCWSQSGSEIKEDELLEKNVSQTKRNLIIIGMEKTIAAVLSEYLFLDYKMLIKPAAGNNEQVVISILVVV
jgi:DNA-binding ferritin-like protein (Dps family)